MQRAMCNNKEEGQSRGGIDEWIGEENKRKMKKRKSLTREEDWKCLTWCVR